MGSRGSVGSRGCVGSREWPFAIEAKGLKGAGGRSITL